MWLMPVGQDRRAVPNWLTVNTNSISAIAYPLRRRLTTTTLLFPLTDANRGAAGIVVAQQLNKEQKQQLDDEEYDAASGGNVGLIPGDYERISPATLASQQQQHHHNSIDECDPDLLGFEIITG